MKLGIFTDSHYSSQEITCGNRYNSRSLEKIKQAYCYFEEEKCDLVICLGDLTDKESTHEKEVENLSKIAQLIRLVRESWQEPFCMLTDLSARHLPLLVMGIAILNPPFSDTRRAFPGWVEEG